ncbi:zinc finger protein ZFP2 [Battus philenor]|uniref:zinc finger protein ZFP2 n=1 Tax=Battus philenor TaxID=42288 RepID=UPI0035CF4B1B
MSAEAASLPCPICLHTGVFKTAQALKDRLIYVSTNNISCPICQEEIIGLDKLTIHLFTHVQMLTPIELSEMNCTNSKIKSESKHVNQTPPATQKKTRTAAAKNKATTTSAPVKFVKIYPKLPVIALNTVPIIDIPADRYIQTTKPIYIPTVKAETTLVQAENKCNVCGIHFIDSDILKMHKCILHNVDDKSDNNFTRFNCHLCPKNFKMRGSLMVHLRVAHYGFSSHSSEITKSSEQQNEKINLEEKSIAVEKSDGKQWQCDVCRKSFTTKYFLKKHKRLHTGETPYACSQCNKTFTFQQSYHKHLLYHNDEKPHICNYCGRAFKELSTLHNHQRIHTGEKPFSCETCGKCFRQRVSYLVHRRIHTGVMPYKCTACEKSFRYKVSQRTHKCQAQPPGTVVRQSGDLVEKLKKKHNGSDTSVPGSEERYNNNINYVEVSEANAELVRSGAKLSLEDMESDNFSIIAEAFNNTTQNQNLLTGGSDTGLVTDNKSTECKDYEIFGSNIDDLIDSLPINEKSVPSPSEILKNLCLTNDDNYIGTH